MSTQMANDYEVVLSRMNSFDFDVLNIEPLEIDFDSEVDSTFEILDEEGY